ncbi:DUF397 domain-containing protein [Streptomyces sp. NPDC048172]|uniref:DUF397 domain-containing protein n=1 Tax=Streptomyces sp. NPDC048172 TaxID=3365505 RepID=UPI0037184BFC
MTTDLRWRTSSYSDGIGQCLEVAETGTGSLVRDSKAAPQGPVLAFPPTAWTAFLAGIKAVPELR